MKVLLVATVQSHICQFHRPLVQMLRTYGCQIDVAAANNLEEKNGLQLDFADRVYPVRFSRKPGSFNNLKAFWLLRKIIKRRQYDVVHCNTPTAGVIARLAVISLRGIDTRIYYTAHGFHFYRGAPAKNWILYYPVEKLLALRTDRLITINKEDYCLAHKHFHTEVHLISGVGVDKERFRPLSSEERDALRIQMGFSPEQKLILCIGELVENKNQLMALRMIVRLRERYPETILLLAGNGPEEKKLRKKVKQENLEESVYFLGYCTQLERYQQIADVSVSCSRREGLPLNVVEGMMAGHPVIATRNRGHRELIRQGKNGWLVDQEDDLAMAVYAEELFADRKLAEQMGRYARYSVRKYSSDNVMQELERIYLS